MSEEIKTEENKSTAWGTSSLVTGILSIILCLAPYFGLPLAIFAIVASRKQKKIMVTSSTTSGFITGIIGLVLNVIVALMVFVSIAFLGGLSGL